MQNFTFITQESSHYLGLKKSQQWLPSAKNNVHVFIYKKGKKPKRFIYKIQTLWKKQDNLLGATDRRKNDMPTEIFSQGLENPLAREWEKLL